MTRATLYLGIGFGIGGWFGGMVYSALLGGIALRSATAYALGVAIGILVAFPIWCRGKHAVGVWLREYPQRVVLVGAGAATIQVVAIWAWWNLYWVVGLPSWVSDFLPPLVLGLWNAFLLGFALGDRFADHRPDSSWTVFWRFGAWPEGKSLGLLGFGSGEVSILRGV